MARSIIFIFTILTIIHASTFSYASDVNFTVAEHKSFEQFGRKNISERLILHTKLDKEALHEFLMTRYQHLRYEKRGEKIFIYAYASMDKVKTYVEWEAMLEWNPPGGVHEPEITFYSDPFSDPGTSK